MDCSTDVHIWHICVLSYRKLAHGMYVFGSKWTYANMRKLGEARLIEVNFCVVAGASDVIGRGNLASGVRNDAACAHFGNVQVTSTTRA